MIARDGAAWVLSAASRLLPRSRRDWGRAMRAELAGLTIGRDRWSFALGCAGMVFRQPVVLRSLAYSVLMAGVMAAIVVWSAGTTYATLRWGAVALVGLLIAVSWVGRISSPLGPVGQSRTARVIRSAGFVMVGVATVGVIAGISRPDKQIEEAQAMLPVLGMVLAFYLLGFVAVTANRTAATTRTLQAAIIAGVGGALLWLVFAVLTPPIPASIGLALEILIAVTGIAAAVTRGDTSQRVLAALTAGAVMTLLLLIEVVLLSTYAPASWIPDLAPAALTPADDLAQSRAEIQDPYVTVLFIGALVALTLGITSITLRRRDDGDQISRSLA